MKLNTSIIICTRDRYNHLKVCLESISSSHSNYPSKELIIVDSSTDDSIRRVNQELTEKFGGKYIYESRKGLSIARNTGIKRSSGEILVFADDDFIVDKQWIKNLIECYKEYDIICCNGRMLSYRMDEVSKLYEKSLTFDRGYKKRVFTKNDISFLKLLKNITLIGNKKLFDKTPVPWAVGFGFCSFRRGIFDEVGYFDAILGRGTPSWGGEDVDMFYRILKAKYKIVYEPKAIIYHNHSKNFNEILSSAYNNGRATRAFFAKYYKDFYMLSCFVGYLFLLIFSLIKASAVSDTNFKKMIVAELRGLLGLNNRGVASP